MRDKRDILLKGKTDSKAVNEVRSLLLTRKETTCVEARQVKVPDQHWGENSAGLCAQAQGKTMKAIAVRQEMRLHLASTRHASRFTVSGATWKTG